MKLLLLPSPYQTFELCGLLSIVFCWSNPSFVEGSTYCLSSKDNLRLYCFCFLPLTTIMTLPLTVAIETEFNSFIQKEIFSSKQSKHYWENMMPSLSPEGKSKKSSILFTIAILMFLLNLYSQDHRTIIFFSRLLLTMMSFTV